MARDEEHLQLMNAGYLCISSLSEVNCTGIRQKDTEH